MTSSDAFSGPGEQAAIEGEPDEELRVLLGDEVGEGDADQIQPVLDD